MNDRQKFFELVKLSVETTGFIKSLRYSVNAEIRELIEKNLTNYQDRLDEILEMKYDR